VQNLRKRRLSVARKRVRRRQRKTNGTAEGMPRVDVVPFEAGSVVATWVRVSARFPTHLS
jgi:hypothetical protein